MKDIQAMLAGALLLIGLSAPLHAAQSCNTTGIRASTPTVNFIVDAANGTVYDKSTRLEWKLCAEGMNWNGTTCTGTPTTHNWQAALGGGASAVSMSFAGKNDWRLPNIKELMSIVEVQCNTPAINTAVFKGAPAVGGTPKQYYWSSTPTKAVLGISPFRVDVDTGEESLVSATTAHYVRLVRGGN